MAVIQTDILAIRSSEDVVRVRQTARAWALDVGFSLVDQTKLVTAASELARNALEHGGGGTVCFEKLNDGSERGLKLTFEDTGPGIPSIEQALRDGYSTGNGLGLGLGGARRLVDEFEIDSTPGVGTRVTITRWKSGYR